MFLGRALPARWIDADAGTRQIRRHGSVLRTKVPETFLERVADRVIVRPQLSGPDDRDHYELAGEGWHPGHYVFDRDGRPLDPDVLGAVFCRAGERAGVSCGLHDLRRAYASRLVEAGTNARVVGDMLGHATVSFTLQTYCHPDDAADAAVAMTIEHALATAKS